MSKSTLLLPVAIACVLASCTMVARMSGAYKTPQPETTATLSTFLEEAGASVDGLFVCPTKAAYKQFADSLGQSIPHLYVFDASGQNLYNNSKCPWQNVRQLDSLRTQAGFRTNGDFRVTQLLQPLALVKGNAPSGQYDYYLFFVWARFVPKLSKEMIADVRAFRGRSGGRIYVGALNMDLQQSWE
ncbi:hypothetical protein [Flaviaesturariibacter amylovorans]|uniref:Uncharacterized protein n=1 Tax=Flaviaesturariibacter amylovorans TaxID=1084520 RepID=A0ABP8HA86_9BACT